VPVQADVSPKSIGILDVVGYRWEGKSNAALSLLRNFGYVGMDVVKEDIIGDADIERTLAWFNKSYSYQYSFTVLKPLPKWFEIAQYSSYDIPPYDVVDPDLNMDIIEEDGLALLVV
jgi:hypothetical protein